MLYGIIGISALFIFVAFLVTEGNARYFMSGFAGLSAAEKNEFPLTAYIRFFRRFHLALGLSFLVVGIGLLYMIDENAAGLFFGIYPIAAYIFFLVVAKRHYSTGRNWPLQLTIVILLISIVLVVILFTRSLGPNELEFHNDVFVVDGSYGISVLYSEINQVDLVEDLPGLKRKRHGYAMGDILKGEFRTEEGTLVRIIADKRFAPYLKITTVKGKTIYLTSAQYTSSEILDKLQPMISTE